MSTPTRADEAGLRRVLAYLELYRDSAPDPSPYREATEDAIRTVQDELRTDRPIAECPECGRGVPASIALQGEELHQAVLKLLAPTYGHDPEVAAVDDCIRAFIAEDAHRVIAVMNEHGLQLVRGTA